MFWKCARIGERLSIYISVCCVIFAVSLYSRDYRLSIADGHRCGYSLAYKRMEDQVWRFWRGDYIPVTFYNPKALEEILRSDCIENALWKKTVLLHFRKFMILVLSA